MAEFLLALMFMGFPFNRLYEFTAEERYYLRRELWLECRGMEDERTTAGLAIVDVIVNRVEIELMGDTIFTVLRWHTDGVWQFPPAATYPCHQIPLRADCPEDWIDLSWADEILDLYEIGARGECAGHYYFASITNFITIPIHYGTQ